MNTSGCGENGAAVSGLAKVKILKVILREFGESSHVVEINLSQILSADWRVAEIAKEVVLIVLVSYQNEGSLKVLETVFGKEAFPLVVFVKCLNAIFASERDAWLVNFVSPFHFLVQPFFSLINGINVEVERRIEVAKGSNVMLGKGCSDIIKVIHGTDTPSREATKHYGLCLVFRSKTLTLDQILDISFN